MSNRFAVATLIALYLLMMGGTAYADSVTINNPSFESANYVVPGFLASGCGSGCSYNLGPIPGWTVSGVGGSFHPGAGQFASVPDGSLTAFTNGGSLSQTLSATVLPSSLYTLTASVGDRLDLPWLNGNYTLSLDTILNGVTTTLCSFTGNATSIGAGNFATEGCTYQSTWSVPAGNLYLLFSAPGPGGTLDELVVDNISLTVQQVPEPSSMLLLGTGVLFLLSIALVGKTSIRLGA